MKKIGLQLFVGVLFLSNMGFAEEHVEKSSSDFFYGAATYCPNKAVDKFNLSGPQRDLISSTTTSTGCLIISPASLLSTTTGFVIDISNLGEADRIARNALSNGGTLTAQETSVIQATLNQSAESGLISNEEAAVAEAGPTKQQLTAVTLIAAAVTTQQQ